VTTYEPILPHTLSAQAIPHLRLDPQGQLRQQAPANLLPITQSLSLPQRSHLKAAIYWLQSYQADTASTNLDRVRGYLEACHHLVELSAWQVVFELLHRQIVTNGVANPLYKQLEIWGNYQEFTDLLRSLLGHLNVENECFCLNQLGRISSARDLFSESAQYHQQALAIAQEIGDQTLLAQVHLGLAEANGWWERCDIGLAHAKTALELAQQLNNLPLQTEAYYYLSSMLTTNGLYRHQKAALSYAEQGLLLAQKLDHWEFQTSLLGTLGTIQMSLGDLQQGLHYYQQQLSLSQATHNLRKQWAALTNLSTMFMLIKDSAHARKLTQEALAIARQLDSSYCETFIFRNQLAMNLSRAVCLMSPESLQQSLELARHQGNLHQQWVLLQSLGANSLHAGQPDHAMAWLEQAEARTYRLSIALVPAFQADLVNFSYLLSRAGNWKAGLRYAQRSRAIARRQQDSKGQFWGILVLAYAYWQGRRWGWTVLLLLRHIPITLAVASRDPSIRYSLIMAIEALSQPWVNLFHRLRRFFQVQPRNQKPR
jgi:hypothetical protein